MTMYRATVVFVNILFYLLPHFTLIKGDANPVVSYITGEKLTHRDAKQRCEMVGLENDVNVTSSSPPLKDDLVWIDASIEYTKWAEYEKTYKFSSTAISDLNIKQTQNKDILRWCIQNCNKSFFGLQDDNCACFSFDPQNEVGSKVKRLGNSKLCSDGTAVCGANDRLSFAVYGAVDIHELEGIGNCLTFKKNKGFTIRPCSYNFGQLCRTFDGSSYFGSLLENNWTSSYDYCKSPDSTVTYSYLKANMNGILNNQQLSGELWLANLRSFGEKSPSDTNATYCLAAEIHDDGTMTKVVKKCTDDLHVLCKGAKQMSNDEKDSPNIPDNVLQLKEILVIVLASILAVVVFIVVVLIYRCVRNKREIKSSIESERKAQSWQQNQNPDYTEVDRPTNNSDSERFTVATDQTRKQPTSQNRNAIYTMVNKPSKGVRKQEQPSNNATDQSASSSDIYDHAHQTPKKQIADDNNYDTMKNLLGEEENVYNTSNEKEESRMIIVDTENEYSHAHFNDENNM